MPDRHARTKYVNMPKLVRDALGNPSRVATTIRGNNAVMEKADWNWPF